MDPEGSPTKSPVMQRLAGAPRSFDFFQAVRLLDRAARAARSGEEAIRTQETGIGCDVPPEREFVRFRSDVSLSFPTTTVVELTPGTSGEDGSVAPGAKGEDKAKPAEIVVSFMGLAGSSGVLPRHYTGLLIDRLREKDSAARAFFDLFNHRLISLFYRAWEKYRFYVQYEGAKTRSGDALDLFTQVLFCLVGMGTDGLRGKMQFPDEALLHYSGHFSHFPRNAIALQMALADYFGVPAHMKQWQGQWLYLNPDDRSRMARPDLPRGLNMQMGVSVVMGERVWDVQGKFRIRLGALTYAEFCRFLPDRGELLALCQMARLYAGPEFDFDVQLLLIGSEVPECKLGDASGVPGRLGRNCWMWSKRSDRIYDDAVFCFEEL